MDTSCCPSVTVATTVAATSTSHIADGHKQDARQAQGQGRQAPGRPVAGVVPRWGSQAAAGAGAGAGAGELTRFSPGIDRIFPTATLKLHLS